MPQQLVTALMVINQGGIFANEYRLSKVVERKFDMFPYSEFTWGLIENGYVRYDMQHGVKLFTITNRGHAFLQENRLQVIEVLKKEFPGEVDIIEAFERP